MTKRTLNLIYLWFIAILALGSIIITLGQFSPHLPFNTPLFNGINDGILVVFAIDYFTRFALARNKRRFFFHNIPDLIAIIPFQSIFSVFRVVRLTRIIQAARILRVIGLTGKIRSRYLAIFRTNGLDYVIVACVFIILVGAGIYSTFEHTSMGTAIWWAFTTVSTVGYGDISPRTTIGRTTAVILMLVGVGFIGMLSSAITTFFIRIDNAHKKEMSTIRLLERYRKLLDNGTLTTAEFAEKKHELLGDSQSDKEKNANQG